MDNKKALPVNNNLRLFANELRKNATKEENHLWYDYLRHYPIRFHRQRIIGNYIVDFYCPKAMLVIELDGSQHYEQDAIIYDIIRTEYINSLGYEVMRFTNLDIINNFEGVCISIEVKIKERIGSL